MNNDGKYSRHNMFGILRFIWEFKSDCQPIFPKMQVHLPTFRKIVICKAPDFSNSLFFSSISFKCHIPNKFHISDEGGGCFFNFLLLIEPKGENSGVTQFNTQFTNVSRQFGALHKKQKK